MKLTNLRALAAGTAAILAVLCGTNGALSQSPEKAGKEWSQSGFGGSKRFKCRLPSCGGAKSIVTADRFGGVSEVPELGIPSGSNLEAEFRRRAEVRRTLQAMLRQVLKESRDKGNRLSMSYFANASHVGFNITAYDAKDKAHLFGQMRVSENVVQFIGSQAETQALARRNFNAVLPAIKTK